VYIVLSEAVCVMWCLRGKGECNGVSGCLMVCGGVRGGCLTVCVAVSGVTEVVCDYVSWRLNVCIRVRGCLGVC